MRTAARVLVRNSLAQKFLHRFARAVVQRIDNLDGAADGAHVLFVVIDTERLVDGGVEVAHGDHAFGHVVAALVGGAVGVVVGGALLGAIWGLLLRWRARAVGPAWITACAALLPLCFVAALPEVIRSGPEAFKALVFEGSLLPLIVLAPAVLFGRRTGRTQNTSRS